LCRPATDSRLLPSQVPQATGRLTAGTPGQSAEVAVEWAARINNALRQATQRPRALLVFVNPFGGARRARRTWQRVAEPVLAAAGAAALHALRTMQ